MKIKQILVFLMAFVLMIQPATAAAAESSTEPVAEEQVETEPVNEKEGETDTNNETDEANVQEPESETSENLTKEPSQDGSDESGQGTEETETAENEITKTETEETEAAKETATAMKDEDTESESGSEESGIVLKLPLLENYDSSPFDFIMDSQGLITETNAAKYDGAGFKEGATLYFKNKDGDYGYSHISDRLSIINRSNVPVRVTVELAVEDAYDISFAQSASFSSEECSMYLALLDSDENETAVGADGKAVFQMVFPAYGRESEASISSFALAGCCNPDGNWFGMAECPCITVNWTLKLLISEEGAADEL